MMTSSPTLEAFTLLEIRASMSTKQSTLAEDMKARTSHARRGHLY